MVGALQQAWDAMLAMHAQDKLGRSCLVQSCSGHKEGASALAAKYPGRPSVIAIVTLGDTDDWDGPPNALEQVSAKTWLVRCPEPDVAINNKHRRPTLKAFNHSPQQRQFACVEATRFVFCGDARHVLADFNDGSWRRPAVRQDAGYTRRFGKVGNVENGDERSHTLVNRWQQPLASWRTKSPAAAPKIDTDSKPRARRAMMPPGGRESADYCPRPGLCPLPAKADLRGVGSHSGFDPQETLAESKYRNAAVTRKRVGFITSRSPRNPRALALHSVKTGYVDGQNVIVEQHWLEGQNNRLPSLLAAKAAPTTTPIILVSKRSSPFGAGRQPCLVGRTNMTGWNSNVARAPR